MTAIRITMYQKKRLQRIDLNIDDVSLAAAGFDEILPQLPSKIVNVDVHDVRQAVAGLVVNVIVDHGSRHQLPAMERQELDEGVFLRREIHHPPPLLDRARDRVDLNVPEPKDRRGLLRGSSDERADPRDQFV